MYKLCFSPTFISDCVPPFPARKVELAFDDTLPNRHHSQAPFGALDLKLPEKKGGLNASTRDSTTNSTITLIPSSLQKEFRCSQLAFTTTSFSSSPEARHSGAQVLDGSAIGAGKPGRRSPALSTASTADGDQGELHSSPSLPSLPPPKLSERATQLLKSPQATARESSPFGTASWGSPYPISDQNLRRQSFSSDLSDDSPVHQIGLDTRFLRPPPEDSQTSEPEDSRPTLSAAATILANRVRRKNTGIKEDWIRAHTAGDTNAEPRLWFSDGSDSEHSSLTGSDFAWVDETGLQTPRTIRPKQSIKEPRAKSSVETLKSNTVVGNKVENLVNMESETEMTALSVPQPSKNSPRGSDAEPTQRGSDKHNTPSPADVALPTTPTKLKKNKPLPADPPVTPRIKKKVPWKGKNIVIQVPRDDERGLEGKAPNPLRPAEVQRMFDSWSELGYSVHGFDLLVEGYHPAGTDDSQSRTTWPLSEDVAIERRGGKYKVQLPDLNAWKDYVLEMQEAKLRALGVEEPAPSISPVTTDASRIPSGQYPPLPFSPPLPTSSASSSHALPGFTYQPQFLTGGISASQSPGIPIGASPVSFGLGQAKFPSHQTTILPASTSPLQLWPNQSAIDSTSMVNMAAAMSHLPYVDAPQQSSTHRRLQSMQPPQQQPLVDDDDAQEESKSSSKTPEPTMKLAGPVSSGTRAAEYHLEEQMRNQFEHEDYNPLQAGESSTRHETLASVHERQASGNLAISEHFAHDQDEPVVLHHPRPHSRGQSFTQGLFRGSDDSHIPGLDRLKQIPESAKGDMGEERYEIETNPSNLGSPVEDFDFASVLAPPPRTTSTSSNPWQDGTTLGNNSRRSSHGNRPISKLNVKAPEFKFNPTSNFIPGLFSFSGQQSQPASAQDTGEVAVDHTAAEQTRFSGSFSTLNAATPAFTPGNSTFSFSTSGPKFRPDAPSFTPSAGATRSVLPPSHPRRSDSIFGNIQVNSDDITKAVRKTRAIPIVEPSADDLIDETVDDNLREDEDGRLTNEPRFKRARSTAPFESDLFASPIEEEANDEFTTDDQPIPSTENTNLNMYQPILDISALDSLPLSDAKAEQEIECEVLPSGQSHKPSLSANAPIFLPGAAAFDSSTKLSGVKNELESSSVLKESKPGPLQLVSALASSKSSPHVSDSARASPKPKRKGLASSRFAIVTATENTTPVEQLSPETALVHSPAPDAAVESRLLESSTAIDPQPAETKLSIAGSEPTLEEIDAVMQHMKADPSMGVNKSLASSAERSPTKGASDHAKSMLSATALEFTPGSGKTGQFPHMPIIEPSDVLEDETRGMVTEAYDAVHDHELKPGTLRLEPAATKSDDALLLKLEAMERQLAEVHRTLSAQPRGGRLSRKDSQSILDGAQESDADDEDDEPVTRRPDSPRKDRRLDQIKAAVLGALTDSQRDLLPTGDHSHAVLSALEDIKLQLAKAPIGLDSNSGTEPKLHQAAAKEPSLSSDADLVKKMEDLQDKVSDLDHKLYFEQTKVEEQIEKRRAAEETAEELRRKLLSSEARIETEVSNCSAYDARVAKLEERLRQLEERNEEEVKMRQAAEDRLVESQRMAKLASDEEKRLREAVENKDSRIRDLEQHAGKKEMKMTLLEAAQSTATQSQSELTNQVNALEADLREVRQDNTHWRTEADKASEAAQRHVSDLETALNDNKRLQSTLVAVTVQLQENERLRESWRSKFTSLQEDMGKAARDISEDTARRIKKEQTMAARQEVLDARLQAEAKTRERLEIEMERLQDNERAGMRAVNECNRLEALLSGLRIENNKLLEAAATHEREKSIANNLLQTNVARAQSTVQGEVDTLRQELTALTASHKSMADEHKGQLEDVRATAESAKLQAIGHLEHVHETAVKDLKAQHDRQIQLAHEDLQRAQDSLQQQMSLQVEKIEYLQDRNKHLEEKVLVANEAAAAAAQAAKAAGSEAQPTIPTASLSGDRLDLPPKISPQALRESIMVLQEQLQAREQRIEELEQTVANLDPDSAVKISKRDDEITWLRELLAVRHADLQDIIGALSTEEFDRERVKDASIRLKANLQMEEQERERAMNGGSAITLPNIANTLQAATPRVAQAVGSSLNALDRWRKSSQTSFLSGVLSSPTGPARSNATPSRKQSSSFSQRGLLTPPASGVRSLTSDNQPQPTAFASTGRRYASQNLAVNRVRPSASNSNADEQDEANPEAPPSQSEVILQDPSTPTMTPQSGYDSDAQPGDFDENDFFED